MLFSKYVDYINIMSIPMMANAHNYLFNILVDHMVVLWNSKLQDTNLLIQYISHVGMVLEILSQHAPDFLFSEGNGSKT